jgi:hypothetical protein
MLETMGASEMDVLAGIKEQDLPKVGSAASEAACTQVHMRIM